MQPDRAITVRIVSDAAPAVRPEDLGLEPGPRRRVAGLRREEIALLAGVSTDYYQRMEQGRDVNVSSDVLERLGTSALEAPT